MDRDTPIKDQLAANGLAIVSTAEIARLQAENERLLGILQFDRWAHDRHRPSYALNCLYEGEITIAKFCEWMKAFVAGVDEPLPDVKYRSCGCEFTPKELEAENERLRAVLQWLDRLGGLGLDKHERIQAALAEKEPPNGA